MGYKKNVYKLLGENFNLKPDINYTRSLKAM